MLAQNGCLSSDQRELSQAPDKICALIDKNKLDMLLCYSKYSQGHSLLKAYTSPMQ